ncbi:hypothetical protein B0T18DRAFT_85804 [Schizothecium vesticola]|uniref:Secreted protein n=1 Tax=Schizothecium vesticola TaxID=314040 RepID=A0AA40KAM8_9PEZI|nr:hypothetical protein B0T18DRAFT_85804 [Schizothecium vesticola]
MPYPSIYPHPLHPGRFLSWLLLFDPVFVAQEHPPGHPLKVRQPRRFRFTVSLSVAEVEHMGMQIGGTRRIGKHRYCVITE